MLSWLTSVCKVWQDSSARSGLTGSTVRTLADKSFLRHLVLWAGTSTPTARLHRRLGALGGIKLKLLFLAESLSNVECLLAWDIICIILFSMSPVSRVSKYIGLYSTFLILPHLKQGVETLLVLVLKADSSDLIKCVLMRIAAYNSCARTSD